MKYDRARLLSAYFVLYWSSLEAYFLNIDGNIAVLLDPKLVFFSEMSQITTSYYSLSESYTRGDNGTFTFFSSKKLIFGRLNLENLKRQ